MKASSFPIQSLGLIKVTRKSKAGVSYSKFVHEAVKFPAGMNRAARRFFKFNNHRHKTKPLVYRSSQAILKKSTRSITKQSTKRVGLFARFVMWIKQLFRIDSTSRSAKI